MSRPDRILGVLSAAAASLCVALCVALAVRWAPILRDFPTLLSVLHPPIALALIATAAIPLSDRIAGRHANTVMILAGAAVFFFLSTFWWSAFQFHDSHAAVGFLSAELALAAGFAATLRLHRANGRGLIPTNAVATCVAALLIALTGSTNWIFFGIEVFAPEPGTQGTPPSLVTPFVVFGPLIAMIAWRGWRQIRQQSRLAVRDPTIALFSEDRAMDAIPPGAPRCRLRTRAGACHPDR